MSSLLSVCSVVKLEHKGQSVLFSCVLFFRSSGANLNLSHVICELVLICMVLGFRLELTVTNQNYTIEEIKSRLKLGNAYYHLVLNIFSFHLLSRNVKIKVCKTRILRVVLHGCETWSLPINMFTAIEKLVSTA
jgi:hypothetical protein